MKLNTYQHTTSIWIDTWDCMYVIVAAGFGMMWMLNKYV